jgi:hypothetical protein
VGVGKRSLRYLSCMSVALVLSASSFSCAGPVTNQGIVFDPAGGAGQEVHDVRIVGSRTFVLGRRVTSKGSTISEFVGSQVVLRANVPESLRPPLWVPLRFDQLLHVGGWLVFVAIDDSAVPIVSGFVSYRLSDGRLEFFETPGKIEETAEGSSCVFFDAVVRKGVHKIFCFDPRTGTAIQLPDVASGQNVESFVPLGGDRVRVQMKLGGVQKWFEWDGQMWRPGPPSPGVGLATLSGWTGGPTMMLDTSGKTVDVRRVGSSSYGLDRDDCRSADLVNGQVTNELCFLAQSPTKLYVLDSRGFARILTVASVATVAPPVTSPKIGSTSIK